MSESSAQRSPLLPQLSESKPSGVSANMSNQDSVALVLDPGTTQIIKKPRLAGWKLKYQDILPAYNRKNGGSPSEPHETFQSLVDRANDWLRKNTEVLVKTCETITWHSHDTKKLGDGEQMVLSKRMTQNSENFFLRGLRLWLIPQTSNGRSQQQTICYCDYLPEGNDNIQSLVNRANRKIDSGTFRGEVLTAETVGVPLINGNLDSGDTRWTECINDDSPYVFCLRVFYNKQKDKKANLGLKDIVPMLSSDGYEGFPELCDRANTWLKDQSDVLIVNMQSVLVQKDDGPHSETGSACYYTIPGILSEHSPEFFRILRVAYVKPSGEQVTEIPMIYPFTYEVFTPEIVTKGSGDKTKERMEKMKECFSRVHSHLKATGADIICVETVLNPMQLTAINSAQIDPDSMTFLRTIRIYLTAQIGGYEADLKSMISQRASMNIKPRKLSNDEGAPAGPIFLGNVVRREYRYRWLVLAVTVFTCMTIIVVVSVVYSNQT